MQATVGTDAKIKGVSLLVRLPILCPCAREYRLPRRLILLLLLRLPEGRGGVINSPRSVSFFSVSEVGLPLMGDTAVHTAA